jgi:pyruvyl transferase EpsO
MSQSKPALLSSAEILDALKQQFVSALHRYVPRDKPVLYLDYPVHLNIGDILIMKGTEQAFADSGYHVIGRYGWMNFRHTIGDRFDDETTIVFHGGGNFGDLYPVHQRFRERVLSRFPKNRIVMLPQTIHFRSMAELDSSARAFRRHPNITLLTRDAPSLRLARQHFTDQAHSVPDAAHYLWRLLDVTHPSKGKKGTLFLLRDDKETTATVADRVTAAKSCDWLDLIPRWNHHVFGIICRMHMVEGVLDRDLSAQSLWYRQSDHIIRSVINRFSAHNAVVSNRLHAVLLALLLEMPVTLLDNSYGKVRRYFDAWLKNMPDLSMEA